MIAFYQNLTDCFITAEKSQKVARRAALLMSGRAMIFCCQTQTAKNAELIGEETQWHEWSYLGARKLQFYDALAAQMPGIEINAIHDIDVFERAQLDDKRKMLALKLKKMLDCLIYWTKFLDIVRPSDASAFIKNNFNTTFESMQEDAAYGFVNECEKILYLEPSVAEIQKKIYKLLHEQKTYTSIYKEYANSV